jgi:hypothetical protein
LVGTYRYQEGNSSGVGTVNYTLNGNRLEGVWTSQSGQSQTGVLTRQPAASASAGEQKEIAFWESIKSSDDPRDFDDFLKRFPRSDFAALAERRRDALKAVTSPAKPAAATSVIATSPVISSVSSIQPRPDQTIVIGGSGFGTFAPYVGNSNAIRIGVSTGWAAGSTRDSPGDAVTLAVRSWSDTEIVLDGFRGAYGRNNWRLNPGDRVEFQVWNPATLAGPAAFTANVAATQ